MDSCKMIFHVVQPGDTFYRLAQRYQTTVPDIILRNPGVNPYNLQVGTRLRICSGIESGMQQAEELALNNDMRQAWSNHGFWTSMYMMSFLNNLPNQEAVLNRLLQTADDISDVFRPFLPQSVINQLRQLLTEHIQYAGDLMKAVKEQNAQQIDQAESKWYDNADKIARLLADADPKYDYDQLRQSLHMHLDLLKGMIMAENKGEYAEAVRLSNENNNHLMELADMLTKGLMEQFYRR